MKPTKQLDPQLHMLLKLGVCVDLTGVIDFSEITQYFQCSFLLVASFLDEDVEFTIAGHSFKKGSVVSPVIRLSNREPNRLSKNIFLTKLKKE